MYLVAIGNAFDGMRIVGPWDTPEEALNMLYNMGYSDEEFHLLELETVL